MAAYIQRLHIHCLDWWKVPEGELEWRTSAAEGYCEVCRLSENSETTQH